MKNEANSCYPLIFRTVKRVPKGRVATYGQIARLAGFPRHARLVGYALHSLSNASSPAVPWHRVINARGRISLSEWDGGELQRKLLEAEGVVFSVSGSVDLDRFVWRK